MSLKKRVYDIMFDFPNTRDNVNLLAYYVAYLDDKGTLRPPPRAKFQSDFLSGVLNVVMVDRYRRMLEKEIQEVRGCTYYVRQKHAPKVKREVQKAKLEHPERGDLWR